MISTGRSRCQWTHFPRMEGTRIGIPTSAVMSNDHVL